MKAVVYTFLVLVLLVVVTAWALIAGTDGPPERVPPVTEHDADFVADQMCT
ncbi:MAG: hypothetical protein ABWY83_10300 [Actinomycetota bacterium]